MFIAIDGDNIGKKIEGYILDEDLSNLRKFSKKITELIKTIEEFIIKINGEVYIVGGDNLLANIPNEKVGTVIDKVNTFNSEFDIKFSVGYSEDLKNTYLALKYAKSLSLGKIVFAKLENKKISFEII